jgi:hypothetical protein
MEQELLKMIWKTDISIFGTVFWIEVFSRANGKGFALTRYSPDDIIITDGRSIEDAFLRHNRVLPLAIDCRLRISLSAGHEIHN